MDLFGKGTLGMLWPCLVLLQRSLFLMAPARDVQLTFHKHTFSYRESNIWLDDGSFRKFCFCQDKLVRRTFHSQGERDGSGGRGSSECFPSLWMSQHHPSSQVVNGRSYIKQVVTSGHKDDSRTSCRLW